MKVKELISTLCEFNPNAEVMFNDNGTDYPLKLYGWSCNDCEEGIDTKIDTDSVSFCVKENSESVSDFKEDEISDDEFWNVVHSINWRKLTENYENYIRKSEEISRELYGTKDKNWADKIFQKIRDKEEEIDAVLKPIWLGNDWDKKGSFISDDSYWDLKAHIVGCGKDAFEKAVSRPETVFDDYIKDKKFKENFEYWTHKWEN